jgi:hypothetical protein
LLIGAKAYFYQTGTTNPQDTYADAELTTEHANPVVADAAGVFPEIYLDPSLVYRYTLKTASGVELYTADPANDLVVSSDIIASHLTQAIIGAKLYPITSEETAATVTPTSYAYPPNLYDVRRTGAVGDGATDSRNAFHKASAAGGSIFVPRGTYSIQSNVTIARNIVFEQGAILKPAASVTITINGWINAGDWQIFDTSAASSLITGAIKNPRLLPEWWGAAGDDTADDLLPIQRCARAAYDAGMKGVQLLDKTYRVTDTIHGNGYDSQDPDAPSWYGMDKRQTVLHLDTASANKSILKFRGGSGTLCGAVVRDIQFDGNATSRGIEFSDKCGMRAVDCLFDTNVTGIWWHNADSGSFTEYCVADRCQFTPNCTSAGTYEKGSGVDSFHGSGLVNRCTHNIPSGGVTIYIGPAAKPYNCPLDVNVWAEAVTVALIDNDSTAPTSFHGQITYELQSGGVLTLATSNNVWFAGPIVGTGESVSGGTLYRVGSVVINSNSTITPLDTRRGFTQAITTGANTLVGLGGPGRFVWIEFTATDYNYRSLLYVERIAGGAGNVDELAAVTTVNTAAYGAPAYTVNTDGNLVATQAGWPASGVTCRWYETQVSAGDAGGILQAF